MNIATIEELAFILKEARRENLPNPIFFLGAGASKTGGIPLADEIADDILKRFANNPKIKKLRNEDKTYFKLLECLQPLTRNELLKGYVDSAKINVTHIYLAQLLKQGYIDYVLTVNFDNLMLRALALFNEFPPTYDMAILKDLTTTSFKKKSIVYLHGQHHGLWLLNTAEEMGKVRMLVPKIFDSIKNKRPWIFIGYGGKDPIIEHIINLGRFDNGLYWITFYDNDPCDKVCQELLKKPNTNAHIIKGYDADSFMLKLNSELKLPHPTIIDKPFTLLQEMLNNIIDIDEKEHFMGVKERLEIAKDQVNKAIQGFEKGKVKSSEKIYKNTAIDLLKKEIINLMIKKDYKDYNINSLNKKAKKFNNTEINSLLAFINLDWGNSLINIAQTKTGDELNLFYNHAFDKFKKAIELKPNFHEAFYNWGTNLGKLARTKSGDQAESLYNQAFEKFRRAIDIKPDYYQAFYNWGIDLGKLAETKTGGKAESLYNQAFEKFKRAIDIKSDFHYAYTNWGAFLGQLAEIKSGDEAESLFNQSFEKFKRALDIKPNLYEAFYNWGTNLGKLAETKKGNQTESLYEQAFKKLERSIELKPDFHEAFTNWGYYLGNLAETKSGDKAESLYNQAFIKFKRAVELKPDFYEAYNNWGSNLGKLARTKSGDQAESLYNQAFEKFNKAVELKPDFYKIFYNWGTNLGKLARTKSGDQSESLYNQAFEKFRRAIGIKPDYHEVFYNWGTYLGNLAESKLGDKSESLYNQAFEKFKMAIEIKPNNHEAFNNWGIYLSRLAATKSGNKSESLYNQAFEKFKMAIDIKPDFHEAYNNWGGFLALYARTKSGNDVERLYDQAIGKLKKAVTLGPSYYSLACVYVLKSDKENALFYLKKSLENKEIKTEFVEVDEDWIKYLEDDDFKEIIRLFANS